ncbi:uncharacterized protein ARMOST_10107 [Armillaria ostoyae]|uniref:Uncharacterized protein n=1 Tax=Armillaria ostoyae TaxID=47428 RepID=A0A284RDI7_ARMOS|nr:uncharacterized protein ARMOST_10107 [Armillaria ostoyae]
MLKHLKKSWSGYRVPDDITVIGARKIVNGGIAYTFNSDEAAVWLRTLGALENIRKASGDETAASLQLNNVVVPFAPTTIDIGDIKTWRGIKSSSGLMAGTIRNVRFLKPAEHHHEGQREAHIVMGLDSREQANKIIQAGVIIEGKELQARKELPDATRTAQTPQNVDDVQAAMRRGTAKSPTAKNSIVLTVRSTAMGLLTAMPVLLSLELPTLYIAATPS